MDRKSKVLLFLVFILTLLSVGGTFYKTVITDDFEIVTE